MTEGNTGGQGPPDEHPREDKRGELRREEQGDGQGKSELGNPPSDLEIANWPRDEDVADDERDAAPKLELPKIAGSTQNELPGAHAIGVPVDATE